MIFHVSFGVRDPAHVAGVLAEITGAKTVQAPSPPFPSGSWFVCFADVRGTFVEVLPATVAFNPDAPFGLQLRPEFLHHSAAHVLLSAASSADEIHAIASREKWRVQEVETGLFKVIKIWTDDVVLVEFLCDEEVTRYAGAFGATGLATLDEKLRAMEQTLANALSRKPV